MPHSSANGPIRVTVLGSTGTIGVNTLDVIARHPRRYRAYALTAHRDLERLYQQCLAHNPAYAVMADEDLAPALARKLAEAGLDTTVLAGAAGLEQVASLPATDYVMAAIVGAAGLLATLAAARAGKRVLLANKEALVMAGPLFMRAIRNADATLLPIDSEHNALFQCMPRGLPEHLQAVGVERILLTASGGPFRDLSPTELEVVTPAQACAHPNWVMGRKISIDSATMMNKGLEVIEACWLFNCNPRQIEVVLHPQSVVHSMVAFADGSVLAQMGNPDMRTPIAHALAWPERLASGVQPLDLVAVARLDFLALEPRRFPCLELAYQALRAGGTATTILNAANEVAVQSFLNEQIAFTAIPRIIADTLDRCPALEAESLETIVAADHGARETAHELVATTRAAD